MTSKRKRNPHSSPIISQKRQKIAAITTGKGNIVKSALLSHLFVQVFTLREYILSRLPSHSKVRRKKIRDVGKNNSDDAEFADFLDTTLIGLRKGSNTSDERWQQWNNFSQKANESASTLANLTGLGKFSQSEIVDFTIWQLFSRPRPSNSRPHHLLCEGFRQETRSRSEEAPSGIPGLTSTYPNSHVTSMKAMPWPRILSLWGNEGEKAMLDLLLDCGIFVCVAGGQEVYSQLSGVPLGELKTLTPQYPNSPLQVENEMSRQAIRGPSEITFVRHRMLYARAALNSQGLVHFGLRHIHVLNRVPYGSTKSRHGKSRDDDVDSLASATIHVMLYIFPRQFGLHNVFTDNVDNRQTVQLFQDYTLREDEISTKFPDASSIKVPKRLRGKAVELTKKLQHQHGKCSYTKLLNQFCPVSHHPLSAFPPAPPATDTVSAGLKTQLSMPSGKEERSSNIHLTFSSGKIVTPKQSLMDYATPTQMVSAFSRAVLSQVIPKEFWGTSDVQEHNIMVFHRNVHRFIALRRFESLSLHEATQGLKIQGVDWLGFKNQHHKMSQSDVQKRWEIFNEFVYYVFDSFLIPLIRSNFHVTESNTHRYRLFFFRQDVWKAIAEPSLSTLKLSMFEELKLQRAQQILGSRTLGYSQMRLLPKERGIRPIMNLRRRMVKRETNFLASSINAILAPVHNVFNYEKALNPSRLGSALFSVGDMYPCLKAFQAGHDGKKPLYFAKLDVQSAFDTIPQSAIIDLMRSLASEDEYRIAKHLEMKPGEDCRANSRSKPSRKWISLAHASDDLDTFEEIVQHDLALGRKNTVFVENIVNQFRNASEILDLLEEHVHRNLVKIGKKFYRQKRGIPQGSVLSSLLCNYFYADLESKHLGFLVEGESLLLRLIDDFLLITSNPSHAKSFLQVMHDGVPSYGVKVNPEKTLVNFEVDVNGQKIRRLVGKKKFPYCGNFIDTETLEIRRDRERRKDLSIGDSLTVEYSRHPGRTFHRKVLNSFKIQAHAMLLDTCFNSVPTVLENMYTAFIETANKTWTYSKCLPVGKQPGTSLFIKTIQDLAELSFVLIRSKGRNKKNSGFRCAVTKTEVEWLALNAFYRVLCKRQSKYVKVLEWIDNRIGQLKGNTKFSTRTLGIISMKMDD